MEFHEGCAVIKVTVCGDEGVGKTSLTRRFAHGTFNINEAGTIGVSFEVRHLSGTHYKLQIWDTSGHPRFRSVIKSYFLGCAVILFVYDVSNRDSFEAIEHTWIKEANWTLANNNNQRYERAGDPRVLAFLVGTKTDLVAKVTQDEAREYAAARNMAGSWVVSAKQDAECSKHVFGGIVAALEAHGVGVLTVQETPLKMTIVYPDNVNLLEDEEEEDGGRSNGRTCCCCSLY
jgi:small GTP-binding protein